MKMKNISLLLVLTLLLGSIVFDMPSSVYGASKSKPVDYNELSNANSVKSIGSKQADGVIIQLSKNAEKYKKGDSIANNVTISKIWDFGKKGSRVALVKSSKYSNSQLLNAVNSLKDVTSATYNYKRKVCANDAYNKYQWGIDDSSKHGISLNSEWSKGHVGSNENIVAIIDTGIDLKNSELSGKLWNNPYQPTLAGAHGYDFVNNDTNPTDDFGHGTFCAGIIAAANDGVGVQGINKNVKIMSLKAFDEDGYGDDASIISSFNYIYKAMTMKKPANVVAVNCSFGGYGYDAILEKLINSIGELGAITVCAAGNEANDNDVNPAYPASYDSPYIISVGALNREGQLATFSNFGSSNVDIAAPGTDILSTTNEYIYNPTLYSDDNTINNKFYNCSNIPSKIKSNSNYCIDKTNGFISDGNCLKVNFTPCEDSEETDWEYVAIPYKVPSNFNKDNPMNFSAMAKIDCNHNVTEDDLFDGNFSEFLYFDVPATVLNPLTKEGKQFAAHNIDPLLNYNFDGNIISGKENYFNHITLSTKYCTNSQINQYEANQDRYIIIVGYGVDNFTAYLDDIGISNSVPESKLGKYDFSNGTSFSTPHVTGAVALINAADRAKDGFNNEMVLNDVMSACDDSLNLDV